MNKRNIKKQFYVSRKEDELLKKKAKKACLTEAGLIRFLIKGYEPREKPDEEFYDEMKKIAGFADSISRIAGRESEEEMRALLLQEVKQWHSFQAKLEKRFLQPEENSRIWQ